MSSEIFKVIIAGSREYTDYEALKEKVDKILARKVGEGKEIVIVSGCARGVDTLAIEYALEKGYTVERYPADWSLGKSAGCLRNIEMAKVADALIAFPKLTESGYSRGTSHMIKEAEKRNLLVRVIPV